MTQQDPVLRYAELKQQINKAEVELELLQPTVLKIVVEQKALQDDPKKPMEVPGVGSYNIMRKKSWQFSDAVLDLKAKATELETQEKATGVATFEETEVLIFREVK